MIFKNIKNKDLLDNSFLNNNPLHYFFEILILQRNCLLSL